jgi:(p)ppGpp synthase/HD superfamily hydrolase
LATKDNPMVVTSFERRAQSNTQLYGQLLSAGRGLNEVKSVRDAYVLAAKLFAGQLRPDGRPFVCHLVGVASILALLDATHHTVIAGLLHSAYTHGDFGSGRGQTTHKAHERLRAAVGPQVERLVSVYSRHPWNPSTVAGWSQNAETLDADTRQIVLIRLVDTLEDALDHGLHLSARMDNPHRAISPDALASLASALGYAQVATSLRHVLQAADDTLGLSLLRQSEVGSYMVCPASWRERLLPRFVRLAQRIRAAF